MENILYILVDLDKYKAESCRLNQERNLGETITLKEFGDKKFQIVVKNSVVTDDISDAPIYTVDSIEEN